MDNSQTVNPQVRAGERGQSLVEYALIAAFVILAFAVTLAMTGPAIGNIFSNVVYNLIGQSPGEAVADLSLQGAPVWFWRTVTWVAQHPQGETPYPTRINRPDQPVPTAYTPINPPLNTSTYTPTSTFTPSPSSTPTPSPTPTHGPSQTPGDKEHSIPFADRADNDLNWRLDRSFIINTGGWTGNYYNGAACSGTDPDPAVSAATTQINYDWGGQSPHDSINDENFVACWQNNFTIGQATQLRFTAANLAGGTLVVRDGGTVILNADSSGDTATYTLPATGTISATYTHTTGNAAVALDIQRISQNPSDLPASTDGCPWAAVDDTTPVSLFSGSPSNVFEDNPPLGASSWPAGQTCYLELRGWINSASRPNPKLSFWDVWDFSSLPSGVTAQLQIANYTPVDAANPAVLDRSVWNTPLRTINLRSPGTANYNWSRYEENIGAIPGISDRWTFRFVLSTTSTAAISWYIDDVQVLSDPTPNRTFTVNDFWNLNQRSQMDDFIFNADANFTLEQTSASPASSDWRWNLLSDQARSGTAWALKNYAPSAAATGGAGRERIYSLEFAYPIDLTAARDPAVPAADTEADTGDPILTFWQAYQLNTGSSIRVEYYNPGSGAWTIIPDSAPSSFANEGMLLNFNTPSTGGRNETTVRTSAAPLPVSIHLTEIPNWDTQPFRLRFALIINQGATVNPNDGWFIDDIYIERDVGSPYVSYPFVDSVEDSSFSAQTWLRTGTWAASTQNGGYANSGHSYTDSPGIGANYVPNVDSYLEMRRTIDLLKDTPGAATITAAIAPKLSFWMRRDLQGTFEVQLWTPQSNNWTVAWTMDNTGGRSTNNAWERVEIDLKEALYRNTGELWGAVTGDGDLDDDDIRIRFHLKGTVAYDGIWLDEIHLDEASTLTHRLWAGGDGEYVDAIDTQAPQSWAFNQRWYLGGTWAALNNVGTPGNLALSDSPGGNYQKSSLVMAEIGPVIDLTSTGSTLPSLDFFTRYFVADQDSIRVEIALENTGDISAHAAQVYNDIFGWNAWTPATLYPMNSTAVSGVRTDTLVRWRVNLSSYVGRRIRVRFVLDTNGDDTAADGITIDNVALRYVSSADMIAVPWTVPNGSLTEWIQEGDWGTTQQFFTAGSPTDLGTGPEYAWHGLVYDCETMAQGACNLTTTYDLMFAADTTSVFDTTAALSPGVERPSPNPVNELNFWLGAGAVPGTSALFADGDTYAGRWQRRVDLAADTTYRIYAISNEGFRLSINDKSGITGGVATSGTPPTHYILNNWVPHSNSLDIQTLQVGAVAANNRILTADFFELTGEAVISISISSGRTSYSDSPNEPRPPNFDTILSTKWGNSALTLNRYFNLAGSRTLSYKLLWSLSVNNTFYVETSSDGGFTWNIVAANTIPASNPPYDSLVNRPPNDNWVPFTVALPAGSYTTFRFRLDTTARADLNSDDGVWISDIAVN
jgi:Flp pilus assembly pilin Flp